MLPPAPRRDPGPGTARRRPGGAEGRGRDAPGPGARGPGEAGREPRGRRGRARGPGARGPGESPARSRRAGVRGPGGSGAAGAGAAGGGERPRAPRSRGGSLPAPVPSGGRVCHCGPPPDGAAPAMPPPAPAPRPAVTPGPRGVVASERWARRPNGPGVRCGGGIRRDAPPPELPARTDRFGGSRAQRVREHGRPRPAQVGGVAVSRDSPGRPGPPPRADWPSRPSSARDCLGPATGFVRAATPPSRGAVDHVGTASSRPPGRRRFSIG
uniref:basic proline-rich protein-like n=1 Tax=Jaculus jaculus TaxID=51337 RepID=UPI001E1B1EF2|nr:basic proline-rich protein-like [Jaculus jaculus]